MVKTFSEWCRNPDPLPEWAEGAGNDALRPIEAGDFVYSRRWDDWYTTAIPVDRNTSVIIGRVRIPTPKPKPKPATCIYLNGSPPECDFTGEAPDGLCGPDCPGYKKPEPQTVEVGDEVICGECVRFGDQIAQGVVKQLKPADGGFCFETGGWIHSVKNARILRKASQIAAEKAAEKPEILLSEDELNRLDYEGRDVEIFGAYKVRLCRAQLRKVFAWLDYRVSEGYDEINRLRVVVKIAPGDWQQLRREAGLE